MRAHSLAAQLGLVATAGLFAACGGGDQEAPDQGAAPPPATQPAPSAGGAAAPANLPPGATAEMVAQGQQIFHGQGICFTCHGQNGQGSPLGPSLADNQWLWINQGADAYEQIVQTVKTGVSQPKENPAPMPPMGGAQLSEEQLRAVAAYVYSLGGIQGG